MAEAMFEAYEIGDIKTARSGGDKSYLVTTGRKKKPSKLKNFAYALKK